jgi:hypothetical protein
VAGDGTEGWDSAPAPERTWYARCEHGTLADHPASFEAYFELLEQGQTTRLLREPPRARSGAGRQPLPPVPAPALLPETDEALAAYVLQAEGDGPETEAAADPIEVRIVHGGLDYARFPLLVGHYVGEQLTGATSRIDEKLGGQLKTALDLRLFVGASRTAHYLRPNNHSQDEPVYPGAVVLGLGMLGELTPAVLAETVTRGLLRYAFEHLHRDPWAPPEDQPVDLRVSSVLLGTQIQAVGTRDSLAGLLAGVWRAAQHVRRLGSAARPVRITALEVIEIDEHIALDAAYELRRLLRRGEWAERFHWPSGVIEPRQGRQTGYRPRDSGSNWQRLVIRPTDTGGLSFALVGSHARVEATHVHADVASLRHFIDRVSDDRGERGDRVGPTDPRLGRVLFQLLLPHDLKSRLANLDNTVLVVDDKTAAYPWELMCPELDSVELDDAPRPFAVQAGMVRQRLSSEYRQLPRSSANWDALVVGSPSHEGWVDEAGGALHFADLPGARQEAALVCDLLREDRRGWQVQALIGEPGGDVASRVRSEQVRVALLERPYRLLHLAGHGVVDQWLRTVSTGEARWPLRKSGLVLSNQDLLGAADVEQMSTTPEFVFINCCYSGREGLATGERGTPAGGQRAALAASLALKFIEMGARAVIAAGWQVDDEAAVRFAQTFYAKLLDGEAFGEAARAARAEVYDRHGQQTNTWGAYQCYGDPNWRLDGTRGREHTPGQTSRLRDAHTTMSASELAARITQVQAVAGDKPAAVVCQQLDALVQTLQQAPPQRSAWLRDSRVRAALGMAYRALGEHRSAAAYLQLSARTAYSDLRIGDLDALVNSLSRIRDGDPPATTLPQHDTDGSAHAGTLGRESAAALLKQLDGIGDTIQAAWPLRPGAPARGGPGDEGGVLGDEPSAASERRCLLGSLHRRAAAEALAEGRPVAEAVTELGVAAREFAQGFRMKRRERDDLERRTYALSNALMCAALLRLLRPGDDAPLAWLALPDFGQATALAPAGAAPAGEQTVLGWMREAHEHLAELAANADRSTFWHHGSALELRTARGLFGHAWRCSGYTRQQVEQDIRDVRREIDRVLALWPAPVQLESLRHRFTLLGAVVAQCRPPLQAAVDQAPADEAAAQALAMLDEVADLAREGQEKLQWRRRAIG